MQSMYAEEFVCCDSQFRKVSLTDVDWTILRNVATRLITSGTHLGSMIIMVNVTTNLEVSDKTLAKSSDQERGVFRKRYFAAKLYIYFRNMMISDRGKDFRQC